MIDEDRRLVVITAPSCHACRAMEPDFERLVAEAPAGLVVERVDAATQLDRARELGAAATPTVVGLRNGEEVFRAVGRRSAAELREMAASLAASADVPRAVRSSADGPLRLGAGAALTAIGLLAGPAWPLAAMGVFVTGWGVMSWRQRPA